MEGEQAWVPVRQGSVADLIARSIVDMVAGESLRPGDRLPPERELAALLGVGRPSLREALRSLKSQGRVAIRHGAGVFVADPETTRVLRTALYAEAIDLEELFNMREVLELPAAAWAARNGRNGDMTKVKKVVEAYETAAEASLEPDLDWNHLGALDAAFHLRIVEAADNQFLARTQGILQEILSRGMETTLRIPGRLEKSRADHRRIMDAILAGNPTAARRAAQIHIRAARKAALDRMRQEVSKDQRSGE